MTADAYLHSLLLKYQVNAIGARMIAQKQVVPIIQKWADRYLVDIRLSGSIAKGTANAGTNDMDLFISLSSTTSETLQEIYSSLFVVAEQYWDARKQDVSIGIQAGGYHFDLVPGRLHAGYQNWHSLWRNKAQTWTQTNIDLQVQTIARSGRTEEIRIIKLWRTLAGLDFPSFPLELATLRALHGCRVGDIARNVSIALSWISANIQTAKLVDPANTNNVVSDDLTTMQKTAISRAAGAARAKPYYSDFVW